MFPLELGYARPSSCVSSPPQLHPCLASPSHPSSATVALLHARPFSPAAAHDTGGERARGGAVAPKLPTKFAFSSPTSHGARRDGHRCRGLRPSHIPRRPPTEVVGARGRPFFVAFSIAIMPLLAVARRSAGSDHAARFPFWRLDEEDVAVMVVAEALDVLSLALPTVKTNGGSRATWKVAEALDLPFATFCRHEHAAWPATPPRWEGDARGPPPPRGSSTPTTSIPTRRAQSTTRSGRCPRPHRMCRRTTTTCWRWWRSSPNRRPTSRW